MDCKKCGLAIPDESAFCNHCGAKQTAKPKQKIKKTKARGNSTGSVYQLSNGNWRAEVFLGYRVKNGKKHLIRRRRDTFTTKRDALAYLRVLRNSKQVTNQCTLLEKYQTWTDSRDFTQLSKSKQCAYRIAFGRLETLQLLQIGDICREDIQKIVDTVDTYYPARDVRQVMSHLLQLAVIDGQTDKNYAETITLPEKEDPEKDAFTAEEIRALWKDYHAGNEFSGYALLMIYTGMATGELQNVKRDKIDFDMSIINEVGTKNDIRKKSPVIICPFIMPILKALYLRSSKSKNLLNMDEPLFYEAFYATLQRAGCRRLPPNCCRHTTATALAEAGVHPSIIKQIMRHRNYATTLNYTHIDIQPMLDALALLQAEIEQKK
jgi:integrase